MATWASLCAGWSVQLLTDSVEQDEGQLQHVNHDDVDVVAAVLLLSGSGC
jgi:hypothetical protein